MSKKKSENVEVKCGGGGLLLHDGRFAFYIELSIGPDHQFTFESLDSWASDNEMEERLMACMQEFPKVIAKAAKEKNYELVEDFCEKWGIIKIKPHEDEEPEEEGSGPLH